MALYCPTGLAFSPNDEAFSDANFINLATSRTRIDRSYASRAAHLLTVAGLDKGPLPLDCLCPLHNTYPLPQPITFLSLPARRWGMSLIHPLAEALKCSPPISETTTASYVSKFYNSDNFNSLVKSEEDLQNDLEAFVNKIKCEDFDIGTLKSIIPLDAIFCLASKRKTQSLSDVYKELKV